MQHDAQMVLPFLNATSQTLADVTTNVLSSRRHNNSSDVTNFKETLNQFRSVPIQQVRKLLMKYGIDMALFGYSFDLDTMTASCAIKREDGSIYC